jgi:hypothetical protein
VKRHSKIPKTLREPYDVLFRIQRALAGHVSYLAACETNTVFSEYLLYEPVLRVLLARGYAVKCEFPFPALKRRAGRGDHKRIDFEARRRRVHLALEIKWPRRKVRVLNVKGDHAKLAAFRKEHPLAFSFLCVVGQYKQIKSAVLSQNGFAEPWDPIFAFFIRTQYGCRIYELNATRPP